MEVGSVFISTKGNYMIVDKVVKVNKGQEPLFNCYSIFNTKDREFDFYPVLLGVESFGEMVTTFETTFKGQIPHYTKLFIEFRPEYFI